MKRLNKKSHTLIIILPLILFAPVILTGKSLFWGTVSTQFVPWWDFAWDTLLQGQIPLWNPWVGLGAPLMANYQSAIFYPPYWILFIIYSLAGIKWMSWALTFIVVFHLIWSGLGLAKLLEEMGGGKLAQTVGGIAFSLSGYLVARAGFLSINAAAAWLPWILLYSLRIVRSNKNAFWKLSAVMAFQLLAGHAQTSWYSILLAGIWLLYWSLSSSEKNKLKFIWNKLRKFILAGLLAAGLGAIQLIPTVEYLFQSQRSGEYGYAEAMTYSFWPWRFLTLLVPNLFGNPATGNYWGYGNYWEDAVYIGLLPVLIAIGVVIRAIFQKYHKGTADSEPGRRNLILFLSGIVVISFLLALGDNTFIFPFLYRYIPTFSLFQAPSRFSIWAVVALSILAGIGIDQLTKPTGKRLYWMRLAAAGCFAVTIGAMLGWIFLPGVKSTFFIPIGLAGIFGLGTSLLMLFQPAGDQVSKYKTWSFLLVMLVAVDLIIAGWGLNPGIKSDFYENSVRETRSTRTFIAENIEYDLKFNKYFRFDTFDPGVPWQDMHEDLIPNLPILQRHKMVNNFDPIVPGRFKTWLDQYNQVNDLVQHQMTGMMNINLIISPNDQMQKIDTEPVNELRVNSLIKISSNDEETLSEITAQQFDFINSMILASSSAADEADCVDRSDGEITIEKEFPGYIKFNTDLSGNSWIIWSQSWYPGWNAVIDGNQKVEIERANFLFQAVCIPEGEHTVELIYQPMSFLLGAGITLICLAIFIYGLINIRKERPST